ncbi:hypothetical protein BT69DRAFT_1341316 [Atractiella rhizophila]|nr:hypothetical protein BT69DRAFT_1341316 [Atractiella rhizophila]
MLPTSRFILRRSLVRRTYTTESAAGRGTNPQTSIPVQPATYRRPVGGFRGGLLGFLLGTATAGTYFYVQLFQSYQNASSLLLASVESLKDSTQKMSRHVKQIEEVERRLVELEEKAATRKEVEDARKEVKKLYNGLHTETLEVKAHLWGVEQDLAGLSKRDQKEIRLA